MAAPNCEQNNDASRLVRQGTDQIERHPVELDPASAVINEHGVEHGLVFARSYSALLKYFNSHNQVAGDWTPFFATDLSVLLAVASTQDIDEYRSEVKNGFDYLNNLKNAGNAEDLKRSIGYLFALAATLARQIDWLKERLPKDIPLKSELQNLVHTQLAPAFKRLLTYYKADISLPLPHPLIAESIPAIVLFGEPSVSFKFVFDKGLTEDWMLDGFINWNAYTGSLPVEPSVFGSGTTVFERTNHIATHNLFTSVFDLFLKVFARLVRAARTTLDSTLNGWDRHQPHYALYVAFLKLMEYARAETNTLTQRHLDFYYRKILRLKENPSIPGHVHLLVELARQVPGHLLGAGALFNAGKDQVGRDVFYANNRDLVANHAAVASLMSVYRHANEPVITASAGLLHANRIFASPVANSENGMGEALTNDDLAWHPFHNKRYEDGLLKEIKMPPAEIGFVVASHYLWMAEGARKVIVDFDLVGPAPVLPSNLIQELECFLTTEEGWLQKVATTVAIVSGKLRIEIPISGGDPPMTPYLPATHNYQFQTNLPLLMIKLRQSNHSPYIYSALENLVISGVNLVVEANGLKSISVSNDFGPVDNSKPFHPFGPMPILNQALVIGSKEAFQKSLSALSIDFSWLSTPSPFEAIPAPGARIDYLVDGRWVNSTHSGILMGDARATLTGKTGALPLGKTDFTPDEPYQTSSRQGFLRLVLNRSYGQEAFQEALVKFLTTGKDNPGAPPTGPVLSGIAINYSAFQHIDLSSADSFGTREAFFFHLGPFGYAEKHPHHHPTLPIYLLPQFRNNKSREKNEGELYIGFSGLKPPQNVSLLFQVVDGTADPLTVKPVEHLHWSYLSKNEWIPFSPLDVNDRTAGMIVSGLVTLAFPRDAHEPNTLLPEGFTWVRVSVVEKSDAVCRLRLIAAQALEATLVMEGVGAEVPAAELPPGSIAKLETPEAEVKAITQPFPTWGNICPESPEAFYARVSERLRHKDRAVALWDYERLILQAFPSLFRAKCLNHTEYEPSSSGHGIYRELAPGHVTVITIPNVHQQKLRNPLRPYTSLGLLNQVETFLKKRVSGFVHLHVKNPQFEEVRVNCKVRFLPGVDESFFTSKLREEITRFLSPWAFANEGTPLFGGTIYKSTLINFVEERPYVDYVADFQLFHDVNGVAGTMDSVQVDGSRAMSILVSAPPHKHEITVLQGIEQEMMGEKCLCES